MAQPPSVHEEQEMWRWLYGLTHEPHWQTDLASPIDRVNLLYRGVRSQRHRSAKLDRLFGLVPATGDGEHARVTQEAALPDVKEERRPAPAAADAEALPLPSATPVPVEGLYEPPPAHVVPACLQAFPHTSAVFPFLNGEKNSLCIHKLAEEHNRKMAEIRGMRRQGQGCRTVVEALVPKCTLERELAKVGRHWSDEHDAGVSLEPFQKVPLTCPLTQGRLRVPARGAACAHLSAFDLYSFAEQVIKENCSPNYWRCPHCSKQLALSNLYVSPLLSHCLEVWKTQPWPAFKSTHHPLPHRHWEAAFSASRWTQKDALPPKAAAA